VSRSIVVSGVETLTQGETATFTATLHSSSGESSDVSGTVGWSTDTPTVATVDEHGMVTAITAGKVQVRATLQGISGMATVAIVAAAHVSGRVHESAPTEGVTIGGADIVVVDSAGSSRAIVSDTSGNFTVSLRPGAARMIVSAPGYETSTITVDASAETPELSVALVPVLREVRLYFPSEPPSPGSFVVERSFHVDVHHRGELRVAITSESASHSDGESNFCLEVRDSSNKILAHTNGSFDVWPGPIRLDVGVGAYEVKVSICGNSAALSGYPAFSAMTFAGEIKHPS
jgi:hypothetical protein